MKTMPLVYAWFHTQMSDPQKQGGQATDPNLSHSGSTVKTESTEGESRVPREEARASGACPAQPPTWDEELFQGGRGVVEEKGDIEETESDNLAKRLQEFLERSGRNQAADPCKPNPL
eukprot:5146694-Amphidinium_carterae.1